MKGKIRWLPASIFVAYIVLAVAYSVVNPIFESPDELLHYRYIRTLIDRQALPVQVEGEQSESQQPPLYYWLAAITSPVTADQSVPATNPFWGYDVYRPGVDNKNL